MKITKESQIRKGMVIYAVHNVPNFSDITKVKVVSEPYDHIFDDGRTSAKIDIRSDKEYWLNDHIFLSDFGVEADYSSNRLFTTKREAKNHIKRFVPINNNWDLDYDY